MIDFTEAEFLFKYLSGTPESFGLNWLRMNEIFFKRADLFEDQNDCAVPVKFANSTRAKRRAYLESLISRQVPTWSHNKTKQHIRKRERDATIPKTPEAREKYDRKFGRKLTHMFRICSLSRTNASEFMWKKYADSHKGFTIQYDAHALMKHIESLQLKVFPYPVEYRDVIEPFDLDELVKDDTYLKMMIFKLRSEWENEREVRIICYGPLPESPGRSAVTELSNGFTLSIPFSAVAGVFLGQNSEQSLQETITNTLHFKPHKIPLFKVLAVQNQLQLQIQPIEY